MAKTSKQIWLIRHGESEANAGARTSDPADIRLTPVGHKQAEELSCKFTACPELVITSTFIRTIETAKPTRNKFPHIPCEEWHIHEFTYLSPAKCKNSIPVERFPMVKKYWETCDPAYCDGVGAESFIDFVERIRSTIGKLKERKERSIVLFSHEQFLRGLLWMIEKNYPAISHKEMKEYKRLFDAQRIPNCGIVEIELS